MHESNAAAATDQDLIVAGSGIVLAPFLFEQIADLVDPVALIEEISDM